MTDPFDRALMERLLRADLAALADPARAAEAGREALACSVLERAGLLRRAGAIPDDLAPALAAPGTVLAALRFLSGLALSDRFEAILARAAKEEPEEGGDPLESPEHEGEVEALVLRRDRVQAALGEIARHLPVTREARAGLACVLAGLARFDERARAHLPELFAAIPRLQNFKTRFDWKALDPKTYWWWTEIEAALERLDAGAVPLGADPGDGDEDACLESFDDAGFLRAAHAAGEEFPERRAFAAHLLRCPPCREAVREMESLFGRTEAAPLRLAAAGTAEASLEELRARVYRPAAPIPGTAFSVAIGLREADRLRFTFHEAGAAGRTARLDGAEVALEGLGSAKVEGGAAEIALPAGRGLEDSSAAAGIIAWLTGKIALPSARSPEDAVARALAARRTLRRPDGSTLELP